MARIKRQQTLKNLCTDADNSNFICRLLMFDHQLKSMIKEGIISYPWAGYQVDRLIHLIHNEYNPFNENRTWKTDGESDSPQFGLRLEYIYRQVQVPYIMLNSLKDVVVDHRFNRRLCQENAQCIKYIEYDKRSKISHIMMNKSYEDRFLKVEDKI